MRMRRSDGAADQRRLRDVLLQRTQQARPRLLLDPHLRRVDIDSAVYRYFEQVGLNVEETRRSIAEARDRKLAEVRALREQAEHEARRAEERLARVRRDYADGRLDAEDWRDFRAELGAERDAARAEAERLATQLHDVERWGAVKDAETETLRRLSEIRAVIASKTARSRGRGPGGF